MTHNNQQNEIEIRRFLLGEMTDDERALFEERFIGDHGLFESTLVVEDELIEGYLRDTLERADRERFEKSFLSTEKRRGRVAFTRGMLAKLPEYRETADRTIFEPEAVKASWLAPLIAFFKRPTMALAAVAAVLLGVFAGWYLSERSGRGEIEMVREVTPTPVTPTPVPEGPGGNETVPDQPNKETKIPANDANSNKNDNKQPAAQPVITLALFAGTTRSGGTTGTLSLSKDAKGANLVLNLESTDYRSYQAEIVDEDGRRLYQSGRLSPRGSKLGVYVPTQNLQNGDYMVRLSGIRPDGRSESAADYQFRVNRK